MTLLLTQIFFCLLLAALIGAVAAWLLRGSSAQRREEVIQEHWKDRIRQIELERDRNIHKLSAEIDRMKRTVTDEGQSIAMADYEDLAAKMQGQVAEREDAIGRLRVEIQSLRSELSDARAAARQRETVLLQQHEQETANLLARMEQRDDEALDEREAALRRRHERALSEREAALRQEHMQDIAELTERFENNESAALSEQVTMLRQQHDKATAELTAKLVQQKSDAVREREYALQQQHEQELARLRDELEQQGEREPGADRQQIEKLMAEIRQRDDSIAVLRDDLAALNERRALGQRGRQDEQLRAAMDEAVAWQDKYEAAAAELAQLGTDRTQPAVPRYLEAGRSSGHRIGSALSHPGGPKDRLQEIKGIGPVLERKLNDFGIYHFKQIAGFDAGDVARLSNELGRFASRITRDDWVDQARILHKKYHG